MMHSRDRSTPARAPARYVMAVAALLGTLVGSGVSHAQPADAAAFDPKAAARYREMLERKPEAGGIYRRLVELYGRKDGVGELLEEYARLAAEQPTVFGYRMLHGHLLRTVGRDETAAAEYMAAAELKPHSPLPYLSAAALAEAAQDREQASKLYDQGLDRMRGIDEKERLLKHLAGLALRARDGDEAGRRIKALQRLAPGDVHLGGEIAALYETNGYLEEALAQWQSVLAGVRGNAPETVRVHKELALLYIKLDRAAQAEQSLRQALRLVRPGNWHIPEIRSLLVDIYRRRDELRTLIQELEADWNRRDYAQSMLLGALNDEVGQEDAALAAYKAASRARPAEAEPRLKAIAIHERAGRVTEVIQGYEQLIRALPKEFRHTLELADIYHRRGDGAKAAALLAKLARTGARNPEVQQALAERYLRYGDRKRALAAARRLVALDPDNESHLVNLGEQLHLMGRAEEAEATWRRIRSVAPDAASGWAVYGETLASHDRLDEAVDALNRAVEEAPRNLDHRKALAGVLRRADRLADARRQWEEILERSRTRTRVRAAREQIVGLTHELRELEAALDGWRERFSATPPDLAAGHLLGLGTLRLKRFDEAETVWLRLLELDPGDVDALLSLETAYARQYKPEEAIAVLERLAPLVPHRARELYQRMATYALQLQRDDDAVRWAARAVALNPEDAVAHARLGKVYYGKQDLEAAVGAYRRALHLDPKAFANAFELAAIYQDLGRTQQADELYRRILRQAPDDGVVRRAAKRSLQLNTVGGTLASLERELLPLLFRVPSRPVFVEILGDLYQQIVQPLRRRIRHGTPAQAEAARLELQGVAQRAVKPLLEGLSSPDAPRVQRSVELLTLLGTREAAVPLAHLLDHKDVPLRVRTAIALGHIADPRSVRSLARALEDPEREVREGAAWALGRVGSAAAVDVLIRRLQAKEPRGSVRAMLLVALGRSGSPKAVPWIERGLGDAEEIARAAAAWAAGRFPQRAELARALVVSLERDALLVRRHAARALGANWDTDAARVALLRALWSAEPAARAAALRALAQGPARLSPALEEGLAFVDIETGNVHARSFVELLLQGSPEPRRAPGDDSVRVEVAPLTTALKEALSVEGVAAAACLADLDAAPDHIALGPLTPDEGDAAGRRRLEAAVRAALPALRRMASEAPARKRARALSVLGKLGDDGAGPQVEAGLEANAAAVRRAAAEAAGRLKTGALAARLEALAAGDPVWSVRAAAAGALALAGRTESTEVLRAAAADDFALVRAAAAAALGQRPTSDAAQRAATLERLMGLLQDPLPVVRQAAVSSLGQLRASEATAALRGLAADADPGTRSAARQALARLK